MPKLAESGVPKVVRALSPSSVSAEGMRMMFFATSACVMRRAPEGVTASDVIMYTGTMAGVIAWHAANPRGIMRSLAPSQQTGRMAVSEPGAVPSTAKLPFADWLAFQVPRTHLDD